MKREDFLQLVDNKLLTEVGMVSDYINNPDKLEGLNVDQLIQSGVLSQPSTNTFLQESGASSLDGMSKDEFLELLANGGNIKLVNDIVLDDNFASVRKNTTIDLNGYSILAKTRTSSENQAVSYGLVVFDGAELTINGKGSVIAEDGYYSVSVWAYGGTVIINDGIYKNGGDGCDLIYASNAGKVVINGGEFIASKSTHTEPSTANDYNAINVLDADRDTCDVSVRGGRFFKFDPSNNLSEGPNTNFVDPDYYVEVDGDFYVVTPVGIEIED